MAASQDDVTSDTERIIKAFPNEASDYKVTGEPMLESLMPFTRALSKNFAAIKSTGCNKGQLCDLVLNELPDARTTWAPHAVDGYYVGPALDHYRCYRAYITATRSERIANTLVWLPALVDMPKTSSADAAIAAANELIYALQHPHPASPLSPIQDDHVDALQKLADIFRSVVPTKEDPPAPPRVIAADEPTYQKHAIGTKITKLFDGVPYNGVVTAFDPAVKYYHIKYDDGDEEDLDAAELKHHLSSDEQDWTVVENTGAAPRVEFTPSTYKSATRNPGQRRRQKARLTKATANRFAALAMVEEEEAEEDDYQQAQHKQYVPTYEAYEGTVPATASTVHGSLLKPSTFHPRAQTPAHLPPYQPPTTRRFDPKEKATQYRLANAARNYPDPLAEHEWISCALQGAEAAETQRVRDHFKRTIP